MKIFLVCFLSWLAAQLIKVIITSVKYFWAKKQGLDCKKVDFATFFKLGGMPSSHTATVTALCCCIGFAEGFDSHLFSICAVFAFIVMFDAVKVRLPVSKLTDAFNVLQCKVCGATVKDVEKVEGHTIPEIIGGLAVGVGITLCMVKGTGMVI